MWKKGGEWPCAVCIKGVGNNSILCKYCNCWVHKRCSGIRSRLQVASDFKYAVCAGKQVAPVPAERLVYGDVSLECVDKFCYLGDMIGAGGGVEAAVIARIRSGWKKFSELLPRLTSKGTSSRLKGKLYAACVRSVMLYGSETWVIKKED